MTDKPSMDQLSQGIIDVLSETGLEPESSLEFVKDVLGHLAIERFLVISNPAPEYELLKAKVQILVVADGQLFDFIIGEGVLRYDVVPVRAMRRVEERQEEEPSVDGPPRRKVFAAFEWPDAQLTIVAYGEQGQKLTEFVRWLRTSAYGGA